MKTFFCFLLLTLPLFVYSYEIKFIPLRISTYQRVTLENIDNFCPMTGSHLLPSIKMLSPVICSKKVEEKLNVRAHIFESPDTVILIDQDKTIVLNNFKCSLSIKDRDKIISEVETVMKNHKRDCKNKSN